MNSVDRVNRELARLDTELRAGGIDRTSYRAQRRKLLLDFEERETTTQPGVMVSDGSGTETTVVDPKSEDPLPFVLPEPAPQPERIDTSGQRKNKSIAGIAILAIGAVVVLALAGWWFARPKPEASSVTSALPPTASGTPSAPIAGADTPQSLAASLTGSEWTDADLVEFLERWSRLSPAAIEAAAEDSRIWLLRGETGRRLREARETESLEQSSESRERVERLERVQNAVGTP